MAQGRPKHLPAQLRPLLIMNLVQALVQFTILAGDLDRFCHFDAGVCLGAIVFDAFDVLDVAIAWPIVQVGVVLRAFLPTFGDFPESPLVTVVLSRNERKEEERG